MNRKSGLWLQGFALIMAGCTALPMPGPETKSSGKDDGQASVPAAPLPSVQMQKRSPAVTALLSQARTQRADAEYEQATVSLERALRIEARDPEVWFELAVTRFDADDFNAAAQFADRSARLAGDNEILRGKAERLGQAARQRDQ